MFVLYYFTVSGTSNSLQKTKGVGHQKRRKMEGGRREKRGKKLSYQQGYWFFVI